MYMRNEWWERVAKRKDYYYRYDTGIMEALEV